MKEKMILRGNTDTGSKSAMEAAHDRCVRAVNLL